VFKIFKVAGTSMYPTFVPGDFVVSSRFFKSFIDINSIVIFFDNYYSFIIKRVSSKNAEYLILESDNPDTESIFCGKDLSIKQIQYIVLFKIKVKYLRKIINLFKI
jgi:phage repressor protein C with HTH and peptisase S24 domain